MTLTQSQNPTGKQLQGLQLFEAMGGGQTGKGIIPQLPQAVKLNMFLTHEPSARGTELLLKQKLYAVHGHSSGI
jgi:hypothetical protein